MDYTEQKGQLEIGDHVAVQIVDPNVALVSAIKEKMEVMRSSLCIYKVPEDICNRHKDAYYKPAIVSIGPFHHGKPALKDMETHKWQYFHSLLSRRPSLDESLDACVKEIRELEQRALKSYKEPINLSSDEFVEMMIVDGCFIIELFLRYTTMVLRCKGDSIFEESNRLLIIRQDMILLENQLPFFVLQHLFNRVPFTKQLGQSLNELAFNFFKIMIPGDREVLLNRFSRKGNHLLDLLHNCFLPSTPRTEPKTEEHEQTIHCAKKLQDLGIKFKKLWAHSLLDIKFVHGVLKMPQVRINKYTDSLMRNLIALEQCSHVDSPKSPMYITSYVTFMGGLLKSPEDAHLLYQKGIIVSCLYEKEEVGKEVYSLFKKLRDVVSVDDLYYFKLCQEVKAYKRTNWWEKLKPKSNYFKTPRNIFSIVAILLLVLILTGILFFCTLVLSSKFASK